jgi:hypothetical protein
MTVFSQWIKLNHTAFARLTTELPSKRKLLCLLPKVAPDALLTQWPICRLMTCGGMYLTPLIMVLIESTKVHRWEADDHTPWVYASHMHCNLKNRSSVGNQHLSSLAQTVELRWHEMPTQHSIQQPLRKYIILLISIWTLWAHKPGVHKPDSGGGLNFKVATTQISIPDWMPEYKN